VTHPSTLTCAFTKRLTACTCATFLLGCIASRTLLLAQLDCIGCNDRSHTPTTPDDSAYLPHCLNTNMYILLCTTHPRKLRYGDTRLHNQCNTSTYTAGDQPAVATDSHWAGHHFAAPRCEHTKSVKHIDVVAPPLTNTHVPLY
jgi:hypothetical protein